MAVISLLWDTNMAIVMSRENTLYSQTSDKRPAKMHRVSTSGSLMGGGCLQELNHWGSFPSQGQDSSTLWKKIYCMQYV